MSQDPVNLFDFEARARQVLPRYIWDFIEAGAFDEVTLKRNRQAFDAVALRPRYLVDVWERDTSTTILGRKISLPVMMAPAGCQMLAHPEGELATARAAGAAGTLMALSNSSNYNIEQVAGAATGPLWFQLSHRGHEMSELFVHRAEEAGYSAICLTVDAPISWQKERDIRNDFARPKGMDLGNFAEERAKMGVVDGTAESAAWNPPRVPPLTWSDIKWLRSITSLPLVVKGIRTAEDARLCVESGVSGIVVSNHGGRHTDGTLSSIETLPEIDGAVNGQVELYLDSGIRRGSDVLRALALGARGVFIGRPMFWGLAVDGQAGVELVLELLRQEFSRAMGICGATKVEDITRSMVALPHESGWVR